MLCACRIFSISTAKFALILPKARFVPYKHLRPCKEGHYVFEYSRRMFYKQDKNPGVGKCVGIVEDAVSRSSEVFARFVDQIAPEWVELKSLRKAPSPGYKLFTAVITGQREEFTLQKYTASGKVELLLTGKSKGTYCGSVVVPRKNVELCFCCPYQEPEEKAKMKVTSNNKDKDKDKGKDKDKDKITITRTWGRCTAPALPLTLKAQLSRCVIQLVGREKMKEMPEGYYNFVHRVAKHFNRLLQKDNDPLHVKRHKMLETSMYVTKTSITCIENGCNRFYKRP